MSWARGAGNCMVMSCARGTGNYMMMSCLIILFVCGRRSRGVARLQNGWIRFSNDKSLVHDCKKRGELLNLESRDQDQPRSETVSPAAHSKRDSGRLSGRALRKAA